MARSNRQRVEEALTLVGTGFGAYLSERCEAHYGENWLKEVVSGGGPGGKYAGRKPGLDDPDFVLWAATTQWRPILHSELSQSDRSALSMLREIRNRWAHNEAFTLDETCRALDLAHLVLSSAHAPEAEQASELHQEGQRLRYEESVKRSAKAQVAELIGGEIAGMPPWRDIIAPHEDVSSGQFQLAEFAADLRQVARGQARPEYQEPAEFFRRTFLTGGLRTLLSQTMRRMHGAGGDPIIDLMTSFGGGKTHSLLAALHLCSGAPLDSLAGMSDLAQELGFDEMPSGIARCVIVGNDLSPGRPAVKDDGTEVNTVWGELAWQLAGRDGFEFVAEDDAKRTNPGTSTLEALLRSAAPCVVLIDEWIAYARQLWNRDDLPGGSLDTHMSFAQALTEAVKAVTDSMLIVSIPASDAVREDADGDAGIEVGGVGGLEALRRLRAVVHRTDSPWQPATAEEGFEIVRRRLFQPLSAGQLEQRDLVARRFVEMYQQQRGEFPLEVAEPRYEERLRAAYPIHPELFDRLYEDWSALERFQRTRGVLRLMATVIRVLWDRDDRNPLILPASVPLDHSDVFEEITNHLEDNWKPVVDTDVDGRGALPAAIDGETQVLGKVQASRRVARTVFMATAPSVRRDADHAGGRGVDAVRVKLGCALPGDPVAVFGDALRRLSERATHMYVDGSRYWFSTTPSVAQIARGRAENYDAAEIHEELLTAIREERHGGPFDRVHPAPSSSAEVDDDDRVGLVILDPKVTHARNQAASSAIAEAAEILRERGSGARQYQNMLIFLAADINRLPDLLSAVRLRKAWASISDDREAMNLDQFAIRQVETQLATCGDTIRSRLNETFIWLLNPEAEAGGKTTIDARRVEGHGTLVDRASRRVLRDDLVIENYGSSSLRLKLDEIPLWRDGHVSVDQLWEDFARYVYLPRLRRYEVLRAAVESGPQQLNVQEDGFGYADSWDEAAGRYRGLVARGLVENAGRAGLIVKPEVALSQLAEDGDDSEDDAGSGEEDGGDGDDGIVQPTRYFGRASLDPTRLGSQAGDVAKEIVSHLVALDAGVNVTLSIEATYPEGLDERTTRTLAENSRALGFEEFEVE